MDLLKSLRRKGKKVVAFTLILSMVMAMLFSIPAFAATSITFDYTVNNGIGYANAFGGAINHLDAAADIDTIRSVGINFARRDAYLVDIVPTTTIANYKNNVNNVADPSTWDWSKYAWVDLYHTKGIKTMLILSYNVPWNTYNGTMNGVPKDWVVYQDIIKKIYQHFQGKVDYIEVYNEPDIGFLDRTGSPYTTQSQAYREIYYNAATAIRSVDATIPLGGPALAYASNIGWLDEMFTDARISNNINFLSYHYYQANPDGEPQIAQFRNKAASYGKANMPVYVTEWNYTAAYNKDPMNNESTNAIAYLAQRLNDMIRNHANGTGYFAFNKLGYLADDFYSLNANGTLTPKMAVYNLMSKKLGLGAGDFNIKGSSWVNGAAAVTATSAVNSAGKYVGYVINTSTNSDSLSVNLNHLPANVNYKAEIYLADPTHDAATSWQVKTITTNASGSASLGFTLPGRSIAGIKLELATSGSTYQAHVQSIGWQGWVNNEATAGTVGQNLQMEALKVMLVSPPAGAHIKYQAHVQNVGWQSWVYDGAIAGTTGQNLRMEAIKIMLEGAPAGYHVKYRTHVTNIGWQNWVLDGAIAGTTGQNLPIQAIEISVYH